MSKLFNSSTPSFSQTSYSPLRTSQDLLLDDDDPDSNNNSSSTSSGSRLLNTPSSSSSRRNLQPNHHLYHHPAQFSAASPQQQHLGSPQRQFRYRSASQSSSRSIMSDLLSQGHPSTSFAEGEDDSEEDIATKSQRISSPSAASIAAGTAVVTDRSSRRSSAIRPRSLIHAATTVVQMTESSSLSTISAAGESGGSSDSEPSSPPPKYTAEDLEFSEPERLGRDEESPGGYTGNDGDGLLMQASMTLLIAVSGLICAGWLLDVIQHWQVFIDISELIILIPILLNLKGNLEMNLASRLSTAANLGLLDQKPTRNAFIKGNLALLQLQGLAVGSVAGLFSFGLGVIVHPTTNNMSEIALMITASMMCAAASSFVLGAFMCGLVLLCRRYGVNPDNIACPLASSFGDLVTLVILAGCAASLQRYLHSPMAIVILVFFLALIPVWILYVRQNKFVSEVAKEGWVPVFAAMVIASTAGLTLERYITEYPGMALISPVLNGLVGNIGSIYASRISTSLHASMKENYRATERILFAVHIPIEIVFLIVIGLMGLGHMEWSVALVLGYMVVSLSLVVISLWMAKWIVHMFWRRGYDPDNYALPILTSLIDVIGTAFLVAGFWALQYGKAGAGQPDL